MRLILISYPENIASEHEMLRSFFEEGLECFHLRKPGMSREEMKAYLENIPEPFHEKIMLHSHHELQNKFGVKGLHFADAAKKEVQDKKNGACEKSTSCHRLEELETISKPFSYTFLSPLFNSISKTGYTSHFSLNEVKDFLLSRNLPVGVIALGGIDEQHIRICAGLGFNGVAILGAIWKPFLQGMNQKEAKEKWKRILGECNACTSLNQTFLQHSDEA